MRCSWSCTIWAHKAAFAGDFNDNFYGDRGAYHLIQGSHSFIERLLLKEFIVIHYPRYRNTKFVGYGSFYNGLFRPGGVLKFGRFMRQFVL